MSTSVPAPEASFNADARPPIAADATSPTVAGSPADARPLSLDVIVSAGTPDPPEVPTDPGPDVTAPSIPANLHVTGTTSASVSIAWDAATDDVGVSGYRVFRDGTFAAFVGATSWTDSGLTPNATHTYTVKSRDAALNTSAASNAVTATTDAATDTTPPSTPTGLAVTGSTQTTISLSWSASTDNVGVTGYVVLRDGVPAASPSGLTYTDTGLSAGTSHAYAVRAVDAAGNVSGDSTPATGATLAPSDTTAPSTPSSLTVTGTTDATASLSWTASTDNVAVTGYQVFRGPTLVGAPTTNAFTDTGLSPRTTYVYTVKAVDAAGNVSAASTATSATTTGVTPGSEVWPMPSSGGIPDPFLYRNSLMMGNGDYDFLQHPILDLTRTTDGGTFQGHAVKAGGGYGAQNHAQRFRFGIDSLPPWLVAAPDGWLELGGPALGGAVLLGSINLIGGKYRLRNFCVSNFEQRDTYFTYGDIDPTHAGIIPYSGCITLDGATVDVDNWRCAYGGNATSNPNANLMWVVTPPASGSFTLTVNTTDPKTVWGNATVAAQRGYFIGQATTAPIAATPTATLAQRIADALTALGNIGFDTGTNNSTPNGAPNADARDNGDGTFTATFVNDRDNIHVSSMTASAGPDAPRSIETPWYGGYAVLLTGNTTGQMVHGQVDNHLGDTWRYQDTKDFTLARASVWAHPDTAIVKGHGDNFQPLGGFNNSVSKRYALEYVWALAPSGNANIGLDGSPTKRGKYFIGRRCMLNGNVTRTGNKAIALDSYDTAGMVESWYDDRVVGDAGALDQSGTDNTHSPTTPVVIDGYWRMSNGSAFPVSHYPANATVITAPAGMVSITDG